MITLKILERPFRRLLAYEYRIDRRPRNRSELFGLSACDAFWRAIAVEGDLFRWLPFRPKNTGEYTHGA